MSASAQSIITIAGGAADYGRLATTVGIDTSGVAVDPAGNILIADHANRVRRVSAATGVITSVAGNGSRSYSGDGGPATAAGLNDPRRVAVDTAGNVFISDSFNNCIRKVDATTGVITTVAGIGGDTSWGFNGDGFPATITGLTIPWGIALDQAGNLFIADLGSNRIRKVSAATGLVTTVAGGGPIGPDGLPSEPGSFSGDGGPATVARLNGPESVAVDTAGDILIADSGNDRVRKVSTRTGVITTVAGNGLRGSSGDGGPATAAALNTPRAVALDRAGDILIADWYNNRLRKVSNATGVITTVAGNGSETFSGDGGLASAAGLRHPFDVAVDAMGDIVIGVPSRVRKVSAVTGEINTVAGAEDGLPATSVVLDFPTDVAVDVAGNVFVAERSKSRVGKISAATGVFSTVAGGVAEGRSSGFSGDGGPASAASLARPYGVAVDVAENILIADTGNNRIRRVSSATGLIGTVAGNGSGGFSGDGGPATMASIGAFGVAADSAGDIFITGSGLRIRKVTIATGVIATVAGTGDYPTFPYLSGDGGPATAVPLDPQGIAVDWAGNILFADVGRIRKVSVDGVITTVVDGFDGFGATLGWVSPQDVAVDKLGNVFFSNGDERVYKVSAPTGAISIVSGIGATGFSGDGGPATAGSLSGPMGVVVDSRGNLFIADSNNNRIRAVYGCRNRLGGFDSSYPSDGAASDVGELALQWSGAEGAFRYDVLLDERFPPQRVVQRDVTGRGAQLAGLEPGKTYYWQVRAKGDPYCEAVERMSGVRRFTTPLPCRAPGGSALVEPPTPAALTMLSFSAVPNALSYDVYLGVGDSPSLVASGLTSTSYTAAGLLPGRTYRWRVVAHAICNPELTTSSAEGSFTVPGGCEAPSPATLVSPGQGVADVSAGSAVIWNAVAGATSYDVYLGTSADPPLWASSISGTLLPVWLAAGQRYFVRVVAHSACDPAKTSSSETRSFSTASATSCPPPGAPTGVSSTKSTAYLGSTYALSWAPVVGASGYRVERVKGTDSSVETLTTSEPSLLLRASEKASYTHRVTAVAPCGGAGPLSSPLTVSVSTSPPFVTITNPPKGTVIRQPAAGFPLPRLQVEVRNTGTSDFVGFFNTSQTVPFFIMSETATSLRAGEIRIYYLQFSGVPMDQPGVYEGLLTLQPADPTDTSLFPQMGIALNVTGLKATDPIPSTTAPQFLRGGTPVDFVRFQPTAAGESPSDILVDLKNPGSTPLDLVAEVLPDSWVSIADANSPSAWNATAIPPNGTRTLRLGAQRVRGGSGGAFPRYAYLTVRTMDGKSSRLLIQDSDVTAAGPCPGRALLRAGETSWIVPSLVNAGAKGGGRYVSKLLITNLGPDVAQAELYYTPDTGDPGTSGFDCAKVLFASILVPGLDVVALTDPVAELFGIVPPQSSSGQLEIRSSRIGQLRVQSVVDAPAPGGGSFGFQLPTVRSGEGARQNVPYSVIGVQQDDVYRTNLILTETSGEPSSVTVTLYDQTGRALGSSERDLAPYGKKQFPVADLAPTGTVLTAGALEITTNPGSAGTVAGVITVIDGRTGDASSYLAKPMENVTRSTSYAIPSVVVSGTFKSRVEIRNNDTRPVTYTLRYRGSTGTVESAPRRLEPKAENAWANVLGDVFTLGPTSFGPLFIEADSPELAIVSRVYSEQPTGSYGDVIEGYASDDPTATGAGGGMVVTDGLEGTAGNERTRGVRTNLIMTEVEGGAVELEVSIWEKTQRRIAPVGTLGVHLEAHEQKQINDIFGDEGFGIGQKDRLNVLCTVRPKAGSAGRVIALATRIDNVTQDTKNLALRP